MKKICTFGAFLAAGVTALSAEMAHELSFSSRKITGAVKPVTTEADGSYIKQESAAAVGGTVRTVTFTSVPEKTGNLENYVIDPNNSVSFKSARRTGDLAETSEPIPALATARRNHEGLSFTSARQQGFYSAAMTETETKYVTLESANE